MSAARAESNALGFGKLPPGPVVPLRNAGLERSKGAKAGRGVNLFGFFLGDFGLAESARAYARALIGAGIPVALNNISLPIAHSSTNRELKDLIVDSAPHDITLVFANPDQMLRPEFDPVASRYAGTKVIGCWFWELEQIPDGWLPALEHVDGLLAASEFVERSFKAATTKPTICVPIPLTETAGGGLTRGDFGLPENTFIFLTCFDFASSIQRKNPFATIEAFKRAFNSAENVMLLVKCSNGFKFPVELRELLNAAASDRRIRVVDQIIEHAHMVSLQRSCDVFVSLHCSEGFGLALAECMAMGMPVIATGWSGNVDFMKNAWPGLVRFTLEPVTGAQYESANPAALWAVADLQDASSKMRLAFDARSNENGIQNRQIVRQFLDPKRCATNLLNAIHDLELRGELN
ncbi:glycosyltransferase [Lysobacter soyae]|uniref:Glycosyltransferase n=1 Tax=Lysobacter soyae TaxID=2764185 RepID=A0ABX8WM95_9GAMM|nr:glycosyltransferase [Lysobacter sp. CJ11]QYR52740.1 glycosyltransferase [Lysobacter sp. CJ11]